MGDGTDLYGQFDDRGRPAWRRGPWTEAFEPWPFLAGALRRHVAGWHRYGAGIAVLLAAGVSADGLGWSLPWATAVSLFAVSPLFAAAAAKNAGCWREQSAAGLAIRHLRAYSGELLILAAAFAGCSLAGFIGGMAAAGRDNPDSVFYVAAFTSVALALLFAALWPAATGVYVIGGEEKQIRRGKWVWKGPGLAMAARLALSRQALFRVTLPYTAAVALMAAGTFLVGATAGERPAFALAVAAFLPFAFTLNGCLVAVVGRDDGWENALLIQGHPRPAYRP